SASAAAWLMVPGYHRLGYYAPPMSAAVGADIEALCSKCGDVWHVVVAKVGDKIAKVHCKQCNGDHRYRPVHGAPAEAKLPSNRRPPKEPKAPVERWARPA